MEKLTEGLTKKSFSGGCCAKDKRSRWSCAGGAIGVAKPRGKVARRVPVDLGTSVKIAPVNPETFATKAPVELGKLIVSSAERVYESL